MRSLNLAREPFRNERLPTLGTALLVAAALLLCIPHGVLVARVGPSRVASLETQVRSLEEETQAAEAQRDKLAEIRPTEAEAERVAVVKRLVDRRLLRWTQLLADIEKVLPPSLKLTSLEPSPEEGSIRISVTVVGKPGDAEGLIKFIDTLERQPMFAMVTPDSISGDDEGVVGRYSVAYRPEPQAGGRGDAAAPPEDSSAPAEEGE